MSDAPGLVAILEAALLAAGKPMTVAALGALFEEHERPATEDLRAALADIAERCEGRGFELIEVASGFRFQVREQYSPWVGRLWQESPQRYSRALLETLALVAYRQPITRGEIEEIRGVAVSTNIIRTLHERDWIRVVGHRDVPGRPAMYATTRQFLDYFNLKSLDQLPALADIRDLETLNAELGFEPLVSQSGEGEGEGEGTDENENQGETPDNNQHDNQHNNEDEALADATTAEIAETRDDVVADGADTESQEASADEHDGSADGMEPGHETADDDDQGDAVDAIGDDGDPVGESTR